LGRASHSEYLSLLSSGGLRPNGRRTRQHSQAKNHAYLELERQTYIVPSMKYIGTDNFGDDLIPLLPHPRTLTHSDLSNLG
jgi:hypothetical protein